MGLSALVTLVYDIVHRHEPDDHRERTKGHRYGQAPRRSSHQRSDGRRSIRIVPRRHHRDHEGSGCRRLGRGPTITRPRAWDRTSLVARPRTRIVPISARGRPVASGGDADGTCRCRWSPAGAARRAQRHSAARVTRGVVHGRRCLRHLGTGGGTWTPIGPPTAPQAFGTTSPLAAPAIREPDAVDTIHTLQRDHPGPA
jgi:hypothetical protein